MLRLQWEYSDPLRVLKGLLRYLAWLSKGKQDIYYKKHIQKKCKHFKIIINAGYLKINTLES